MSILTEFIKIYKSFYVLILGVNSEFSNHHIYAEKLTNMLNEKFNSNIKHIKIKKMSDIDYSKFGSYRESGLIISSDIILDPKYFQYRGFIMTTDETLDKRGETKRLDLDKWNKFKKSYTLHLFVYDNVPFTFESALKMKENNTLTKMYSSLLEFFDKNISSINPL